MWSASSIRLPGRHMGARLPAALVSTSTGTPQAARLGWRRHAGAVVVLVGVAPPGQHRYTVATHLAYHQRSGVVFHAGGLVPPARCRGTVRASCKCW